MPLGAGLRCPRATPGGGHLRLLRRRPGHDGRSGAAAVAVFVVGDEQPTLRARYGASYDAYCHSVPAVLPRLRRREAKAARR